VLVAAQPESLRFRLVKARDVAERPGFDQRRDHGSAERPGAAGDNDMTIAKVHGHLPARIIADLGGLVIVDRSPMITMRLFFPEGRISG
jgi:hypothetical protein